MFWLLLVASVACGAIGSYVAGEKDRSRVEGAVFGCLLGPLGVLVAALMPAGQTVPDRPRFADRVKELNRRAEPDRSRSIRRID